MSDENEDTPVEERKNDVQIIVSCLGNERRTIQFREINDDQVKTVVRTIESAFSSLRSNDSILLTGSDGLIVFINLENVAFIEVRVG